MRRGAELGAVLLLMAGAAWAAPADDLKDRWRQLVSQAQIAEARGDRVQAASLRAEAYSVQAEIYWADGDRKKAEESFAEARRRCWRGSPPWTGVSSRQDEEFNQPEEKPAPIERLKRKRVPKPDPNAALWESSPYHHSRASTWYSLLGTPPFEEALVMPKLSWRVLTWAEVLTSDFSETSGTVTSRWNATLLRENFQVDYSYADKLAVGMRFRSGELYEVDDTLVRIFEDGTQIVPTATGTFDVDSLILRAKYATHTRAGETGLLMELKVPVALEENLLTSRTFDLGVVGLFTKRVKDFTFHGNLGLVFPIGTPHLFTESDKVNSYVAGALGMGWTALAWLNLGAQFEGNTSAFRSIDVLARNVYTFTTRARIDVGSLGMVSIAVGRGLNESSGEWMYSAGAEVAF